MRPAASATDLFISLCSVYIYIRVFVPYDLLSCTERHHQYVFTTNVLMTLFCYYGSKYMESLTNSK